MNEKEIEKLVIIGGGIAGLTAAIYASRAELNPVVITGIQPGGQLTITTDVENYPGFPEGIMGPDLMEKIKKQSEKFGTRMINGIVTGTELTDKIKIIKLENNKEIKAYSVIIATGASARWLGIPGEEEYRGKGVSACATCDGFFFRDKVVTVIGGGDSALEEANFLTKFASKVIVVHRRDKLRASKIMQEKAFSNKKIEFLWNALPVEMLGDKEKITGLRYKDKISEEEKTVSCDGIFLAIGHIPQTSLFKGKIDMDEKGYITLKGKTTQTNINGVFAAGDVADSRYRQAVSAAGMGCQAAIDTEKYLEESVAELKSWGLLRLKN